ncbi:ComEA family DNA-binding protein [Paenibacillus harenae]|uniref:Competence protein ComEA n=1 Tax=Paenibacillus harenae TaxID=306543 RepID=A0ABT9TWK5_PAEHA|nr:helix-hairpin-helix domain-containing protein [Paenibacillus harenae]MDQ0111748.1 competence protein ComEA [Paenibacillus harenae]
MKKRNARADAKLWLSAAICLVLAAVLFGAAFTQPKQPYAEEWTAMNEEVEHALNGLDSTSDGEGMVLTNEENGNVQDKGKARETKDEEKDASGAVTPDIGAGIESEGNSDEGTGKLDINQATAAELDALKGIGQAKARAIVEDREQNGPFATVNDLLRVRGIGEKLLAGFKEDIVARP